MLHKHSFICYRHCIIFFSKYFSFPCQYHSSNSPYPFILLTPTLYNVFLPILQLPLSVSFHQSSIFIHPSSTGSVCFLPVLHFLLSISFHQRTMLVFILKLFLPERQRACDPFNAFFGNRGRLGRKTFSVFS
jgi:hypothetical protein